ncbi:MAG: twin-arginine translocation signal domain-containing protein [Pedosphaera sp.]|nr:twin-arginine translocation signal domain-containing protein [Pedosphaera sp.]
MTPRDTSSVSTGDSRRSFLRKSAVVTATAATVGNPIKTPVYGQDQAPSTGRVIEAKRPKYRKTISSSVPFAMSGRSDGSRRRNTAA